jgi:hypothetical protein
MLVRSRDYGARRRYRYLCGYHHQRGGTVCVNGLEAPMEITDHAVLDSIKRDLLRPAIVERAIELALDELRPGAAMDQRRAELVAETRRLDAELSRLTRRSPVAATCRRSSGRSRSARRSASVASAP